MSTPESEQLRSLAERATVAGGYLDESTVAQLNELEDRAGEVAKAWSGSNLGYHADVYHGDFIPPPPGRHFSPEWGLTGRGVVGVTTGEWRERDGDQVIQLIQDGVPGLDRAEVEARAAEAREAFATLRSRFSSILSIVLRSVQDDYLAGLRDEVDKLVALTAEQAVRAQLPTGTYGSRDSLAIGGGLMAAPHQVAIAEVIAAKSPARCLKELAGTAILAADHLDLGEGSPSTRLVPTGNRVFIGHGRSPLWRELKDFVQDRLGLAWDEFNRVPVAGITNTSRLENMLNDAGVAFLVLTAEDEQLDGSVRARENVVHEAGLFQGRLGFTNAIILVEEGCEEFSNIQGLGQIRFPKGKISAAFEDVRLVLEREGLIVSA